MKKMIAFLLAAILVLGCTACGSKKDEGNDRLAQIKEKAQIAITSWTRRGKNLGHGWSRRIYP